MSSIYDGVTRGFRGLRTGDQRSVYTGALIIAYGLWRRNRNRRELVYRRQLKEGEAVMIRASRVRSRRIVIGDDLADQVKGRPR
ncbi:MAG: hypothetical protein ACT4OP_06780 [Actinomycetota bacterium]